MDVVSRSRRAAALPPEERRAAIVAAVTPLLRERGLAVTTREIADAAGVAEGTIFRAFADKDALVAAVIEGALDTTQLETAVTAIDRLRPFEEQLEEAVAILQRRVLEIWRLLSMVDDAKAIGGRKGRPLRDVDALVELFEPHRDRLRLDPAQAARTLRSITLATTHPVLNPEGGASAGEIVHLLLDGIRS